MDQNESFLSFWTSLRGGVGPHQFHQILDGLSDALRRLLYVPDITEWYTPQYLAYKAMTDSARHSLNFSVLIRYSTVRNMPSLDLEPVDIPALRARIESGHNGKELLLDILADGRTLANRDELAHLLELPAVEPRDNVALGRGPHEIRFPHMIDIEEDFEPYLLHLQEMWRVWLSLDKARRILTITPRNNGYDIGEDVDAELFYARESIESRHFFLVYILQCMRSGTSVNFMHFYREKYAEMLQDTCILCDNLVEALNTEFPDRTLWQVTREVDLPIRGRTGPL
ncbi:hypothetical protein F4823DRAFT_566197 [Ustulina deusta]|nr:hypothetical protein F4823DRAFT_566197 [Ustulina deusta]